MHTQTQTDTDTDIDRDTDTNTCTVHVNVRVLILRLLRGNSRPAEGPVLGEALSALTHGQTLTRVLLRQLHIADVDQQEERSLYIESHI